MTIFGDIFFTTVRFSAICGRTTVRTALKNRHKPNRLILEHFGENRMFVSIFVQKIASAAHTDKHKDILILLIYTSQWTRRPVSILLTPFHMLLR